MFTLESHIQALIFDCDGTLADTMPLHYLAWRHTVEAWGGHFPERLFYDLGGSSDERIGATLNETLRYQFDIPTLVRDKDAHYLRLVAQAKPIAPVVDIARKYKGCLPLAVATGASPTLVRSTLQAIGLADFFDTIVTPHDVPHAKPAPDTFLECARRLHVEPQYCHVFEDANLGLEGARRAGMSVTDVRPWRVAVY